MRWLITVILMLAVFAWVLDFPGALSQVELTQTDTDPAPYTFCGVSNFAWTDRGVVARAAQPPAQSLTCLRNAGFAAVVNLRHERPGYDEAAAVKALGRKGQIGTATHRKIAPAQTTWLTGTMARSSSHRSRGTTCR